MARHARVVERIAAFNAGREPERLKIKYEALRSSAHRFLRGTCHLFYEDWPRRSGLNDAPNAWICGDLHVENFGAYKGDDRILYFDLNDFDEAVLAPCSWEVTRFTTSVILAARDARLPRREAAGLCRVFLDSYAEALAKGKARRVEPLVATGLVRKLLDALRRRSRLALLQRRTVVSRGGRTLKLGKRALPVTSAERRAVTAFVRSDPRAKERPRFYRVLDVARRVAGTASLGVRRFVILIEGKGSPDGNYLLYLKEARPSSLQTFVPAAQPKFANEADRIVTIQDRVQAVAPALLHAVTLGDVPFVLRELQPTEDRLRMDETPRITQLEGAMRTMGQATAWAQLRGSGRQESAIADDLITFANKRGWQTDVFKYAQEYAAQVESDWVAFTSAAP